MFSSDLPTKQIWINVSPNRNILITGPRGEAEVILDFIEMQEHNGSDTLATPTVI